MLAEARRPLQGGVQRLADEARVVLGELDQLLELPLADHLADVLRAGSGMQDRGAVLDEPLDDQGQAERPTGAMMMKNTKSTLPRMS